MRRVAREMGRKPTIATSLSVLSPWLFQLLVRDAAKAGTWRGGTEVLTAMVRNNGMGRP